MTRTNHGARRLAQSPRVTAGQLQQVRDAGLLFLQFLERLVDAFLAERIDWQVFNHFVLAALARHREPEHRILRDAVLAI